MLTHVAARGDLTGTGAGLRVREVTTTAGFDALRDQWDRVAERMDVRSPFLDWEWSRAWWDSFGGSHGLRILVFEAGAEVAGIAQLHERRQRLGPLHASSLAAIGWEDGGNQPVTEHLELLFPPSQRAALLTALERWLRRRTWTVAWLPNFADGDWLPPWIASHVVARCEMVPHHHRPLLPAVWEDFVQALNKSMRSNCRYYPKLMVRHGHPYTFEVARTPEELESAYELLLELHRRRSEVTSGVRHWDYLRFEGRREFVRRMMISLSERGEARIGVLRVRGEPVSAYLWFERAGRMFLYRSGYDVEWSRYSVALVVAIEALKDAMGRGVGHVEFLRGGGQLKERWDTEFRPLRHLMLARAPRLTRPLLAARAARRPTTYEVV